MFNQLTLEQLEKDVGREVLSTLMVVFCNESTKLTEQLLLCDKLNEDTLRYSHSLKSCARSYGADCLADLAEQLESSVKSQSPAFFELRNKLNQVHTDTMRDMPKF
jgi:two-component system phosphorelay protein LuxU